MKKLILATSFVVMSLGSSAQITPGQPAGADSIATAFIPILGYSSDLGLLGGGLISRYDYTGGARPFNNLMQARGILSTKGLISVEVLYEKTNIFETNIRGKVEAYVDRFKKDTFFGLGNNTSYSQQLWDNEFYFFESVAFGLGLDFRKPLYKEKRAQFDALAGIGFDYQIGYVNQSNSSFSQVMPNGSDGGFVNYLTGGFVWENRDSEFDPHVGNRAELNIRYAPKHLSEFPLTTISLDLRQYVTLFDFVTLAGRVEGRHAGGNVPYWELSTLGNDETLRGYPLNRFKGNSLISYNLEMRSWLIRFPDYGMKIGAHVFTDGGRVFSGQDDFGDLLNNHQHTIGVGGAFSAFGPDFILRGELGFSEDATQLYIGIGYMF